MIDAHIHIGRENSAWPARSYQKMFQEYLSRGITGVRDGGDVQRHGLKAREAAEEVGIAFKTPGYAFVKKGGYGDFLGEMLSGIQEIKEEFRRFLTVKPDFTKVICSGLVSFDEFGEMSSGGFDFDELTYLVNLSHDHGLKVMAHCSGTKNIQKALDAGVDSIEHGYFVNDEQLHQMKEQGTFFVPTFAPYVNFKNSSMATKQQKDVLEKTIAQQEASVKKAVELGVKVALGSDAGAIFVPHGEALLQEIESFVRAGIPREKTMELCIENGKALLE